MQWGLAMELGLKLPFSHSYFPSKHRFLLAKLAGPISCEKFLDLVRFVKGTVVYAKTHLKPATLPSSLGNLRHTAAKATNIDHKSIWYKCCFWFKYKFSCYSLLLSTVHPSCFWLVVAGLCWWISLLGSISPSCYCSGKNVARTSSPQHVKTEQMKRNRHMMQSYIMLLQGFLHG